MEEHRFSNESVDPCSFLQLIFQKSKKFDQLYDLLKEQCVTSDELYFCSLHPAEMTKEQLEKLVKLLKPTDITMHNGWSDRYEALLQVKTQVYLFHVLFSTLDFRSGYLYIFVIMDPPGDI